MVTSGGLGACRSGQSWAHGLSQNALYTVEQ